MKPSARPSQELLAWAAAIIARAQNDEIHGEIRIQMKEGVIVSVKVETSHIPPPHGEGLTPRKK